MESRYPRYDAMDFLPGFYTTAVPSTMTAQQLDGVGFRKRHVIQMHLTSLNLPNCRAFHNEYLEKWWTILGQDVNNIEECRATHYPNTRGDLLLTYRLREPIHLAHIRETVSFNFIAPAPTVCIVHNEDSGRLVVDPATEERPYRVIRNIFCCNRTQNFEFRCTLLGRETRF